MCNVAVKMAPYFSLRSYNDVIEAQSFERGSNQISSVPTSNFFFKARSMTNSS